MVFMDQLDKIYESSLSKFVTLIFSKILMLKVLQALILSLLLLRFFK
ncbi:MAG: hypothetical protein LBC61_03760 [Candidatus Peribacteria bacterium]|nr:hypothetical protein [Candidatus Peribacteria bacterium]